MVETYAKEISGGRAGKTLALVVIPSAVRDDLLHPRRKTAAVGRYSAGKYSDAAAAGGPMTALAAPRVSAQLIISRPPETTMV
jgi:hypothetical protein